MKNLVCACVALSLGLFGCGDDAGDDGATPEKDAGSDAGGGTGGAGGAGGTGGFAGSFDAGPVSECTVVASMICDGPEDCPSGQMCCGGYNGTGYDQFMCADSCVALGEDGSIWSELCHAGQTCEMEGYTCSVNTMYLPASVARCRDTGEPVGEQLSTAAGEVSCGESVCGAGQHCCLRPPFEPYCQDEGTECECDAETQPDTDGGSSDDAG